MTLAIITTRAGVGLDAPEVQVEAHLANEHDILATPGMDVFSPCYT